MTTELFNDWVERFETLESALNQLDAATGDGDHGATMLKGLRAVQLSPEQPAKAFRKAAGGASGSLFSLVIGALDSVIGGRQSLPEALSTAASRITQMGQAVAGDKTMLDALLPAAAATTVTDAVAAARAGCLATQAMSARRGRARYVEGAGVGCIDAGATSVAELLEVFKKHWQEDS